MPGEDWSRDEVSAIVDDYLSMLAAELAGSPYIKAEHRRALRPKLQGRSEQSIEFKHANISAALLDAGFPYINGYKPRSNYQRVVAEVLAGRLRESPTLMELAAQDADRLVVAPEVKDILSILTSKPPMLPPADRVAVTEPGRGIIHLPANYLEREAANRSLGAAGEILVIDYERARLVRAGCEGLAAKIEHTSKVRGDHEGYDILSFEVSGEERLIEVKTTKYGAETPFFVSRNEVETSAKHSASYNVYRLFAFRRAPRLFTLRGHVEKTCYLSAANFLATPR